MDMPTSVKAYFEADGGADPAALDHAFTADAVVEDEGRRHAGRDAIRGWWLAAKAAYDPVAEPLQARRTADRVTVRARVRGRFPNSPVLLDFAFTLRGGLIAGLRIG